MFYNPSSLISKELPILLVSTSKAPPPSSSAILNLNTNNGGTTSSILSHASIRYLFVVPPPSNEYGSPSILMYSDTKNQPLLTCISCTTHKPLWKTFLPEPLSCFASTQHPHFFFIASQTGALSVFDSITGELLKITRAHDRGVSAIAATRDYVWTGGDDGIVCLWKVQDLIDPEEEETQPIFLWSDHSQPVKSLSVLPGGRCVSSGMDCRVCVLEGCNGKTLVVITLPSGVTNQKVDTIGTQVYCGCTNGSIYIINMDAHAMASILHTAKIISTPSESVDGTTSLNTSPTELQGHRSQITCLLLHDSSSALVSSCNNGCVRIWDIPSLSCTRIWEPWNSQQIIYPISCMVLAPQIKEQKHEYKPPPLSRFTTNETCVPVVKHPTRCSNETFDWDTSLKKKRIRLTLECQKQEEADKIKSATVNSTPDSNKLDDLRSELKEAKSTIQRWQKVNNKLMAKLKRSSSKK